MGAAGESAAAIAKRLKRSSEAVRKQFTRAKERFRLAYADVVPKWISQAS